MDTRTQRALEMLAQAVEAEVGVMVEKLEAARRLMELMAATRGVNGLSSMMRGKAQELDSMIALLEEAAEKKAAEFRGQAPARPALLEGVDQAKTEAVREARVAG